MLRMIIMIVVDRGLVWLQPSAIEIWWQWWWGGGGGRLRWWWWFWWGCKCRLQKVKFWHSYGDVRKKNTSLEWKGDLRVKTLFWASTGNSPIEISSTLQMHKKGSDFYLDRCTNYVAQCCRFFKRSSTKGRGRQICICVCILQILFVFQRFINLLWATDGAR